MYNGFIKIQKRKQISNFNNDDENNDDDYNDDDNNDDNDDNDDSSDNDSIIGFESNVIDLDEE